VDLQAKADEIVKKYESLPLQDKIRVIAQTFGCTSGQIEISPCGGKWRGTSDMSIRFDNGASLCIGNARTSLAQTAPVQSEYVTAVLARYNPEIVAMAKSAALTALKEQEIRDNLIAAQKGLKAYTVLNVELNDGTDSRSSGYMGWYYVTLAVDGNIHAHLESGLAYDIASGGVGGAPKREQYYIAGALKEADVDYVFHNVGFSSTSTLYSLPIADAALKRAALTLAQLNETPTQAHKPSIKGQLAAKPISSDAPSRINNNREVR